MPLFRVEDKLHYYAHVPKCAGSAIADYLTARCGGLAFQNNQFLSDDEPNRWTKSSPQHVDWESFTKVIPADWIASSFAVVRHPTARVISAYHFQQEIEQAIPAEMNIDTWFTNWADNAKPFAFDNHLLPQSQIVPPEATIFKLEDGLEAVISYLDGIIGNTDGPRALGGKNTRSDRTRTDKAAPSQATLDLIAKTYAEDFERFGYALGMPEVSGTARKQPSAFARFFSKFKGAA
jgi:hypothetical protein